MFDLIIIGAGAAGLMAARTAATTAKVAPATTRWRIAVLESSPGPGQKLAISGGGKANFSNSSVTAQDYIGQDPEFTKYILKAFPPKKLLAYLDRHQLDYAERDHGRLFCLKPADKLVEALYNDCLKAQVDFFFNTPALEIHPQQLGFEIITPKKILHCQQLILALGSSAWPQCGATGDGYRLGKNLGHKIIPVYPVLTPLLMPLDWPLSGLAGISCPVGLNFPQCSIVDDLLFTHQGVSGPAMLTASCYWQPPAPFQVDFLPHQSLKTSLDDPKHGKLLLKTLLKQHLPDRLALLLLPPELQNRKIAELSRQDRINICQTIHSYPLLPKARSGIKKAEAMAGGISTKELNPKTLASQIQPNLFMCGEMLDITGRLGGYNLHFAFASGYVAGQYANISQ